MIARMLLTLGKCREGSVLLLVGLGVLIIFAMGGAAVDFGRAQLIHAKLQQATDAAGLAYAATDAANPDDVARRYYELNYPATYMGLPRPELIISTASGIVLTTAPLQMQTNFIRFVDMTDAHSLDFLEISATTRINSSTKSQPYDVMLVVDNSGSMASDVGSVVPKPADIGPARSKGQAACAAIYPRISYPISDCYSIPDGASNVDDPPAFGLTSNSRLNAVRDSAKTIATRLFAAANGSRVGMVNWSTSVIDTQGLVTDAGLINSKLDGMVAFGATNSTAGLSEAQNAFNAAPDPTHVKAVVLLSDGFNTTTNRNLRSDGAGGAIDDDLCKGTDRGQPVCRPANDASERLCDALKASDTRIYTIAFGEDVRTGAHQAADAQAFLQDCASPNPAGGSNEGVYFFVAPDAGTLKDAFDKILVSLKKVRISG